MFAQTFGSTTVGINGAIVTVEVDIANGIPGLDIVGLPDTSVKESRERVRAAIKNAGFEYPLRRITVNLAPADMKKDGSGLDLAIAVGILTASGQLDPATIADGVFIGELSLEGKLRSVSGMLPMAFTVAEQGYKALYVAPENAQEALCGNTVTVYAPASLGELMAHFRQEVLLRRVEKETGPVKVDSPAEDLADVQGQAAAKRALEIAAAGGHNLLMVGPPGSGKTMLARRLPSILPPLTEQEAFEVAKIYSVAGMPASSVQYFTRPFRSPHHTVSDAGLIGGGRLPRPGEITLSHYGVLFLDELPEFPRQVLEVLRQPMEDGEVTISRVNATLTYPARFTLVAAMNPCPCGFYGETAGQCSCSSADLRRYIRKISGPLLDRMDIHISVPRMEYGDFTANHPAETSAVIRARVEVARRIQQQRLSRSGLSANAQMGHRQVKSFCVLTDEARELLRQAFDKLGLSARGYDRILKVARTIADLAGNQTIPATAVAEAIHLRNDLRERW